jgi:hypothetical protein
VRIAAPKALPVNCVFPQKVPVTELGQSQLLARRGERVIVKCLTIAMVQVAVPEIQQLLESRVPPGVPATGTEGERFR